MAYKGNIFIYFKVIMGLSNFCVQLLTILLLLIKEFGGLLIKLLKKIVTILD